MEKNIKKIEDMSLNAWPSHKMELYDGWILRFSYFYTHRTNSVEQFGTLRFHGVKRLPTAKMFTNVWDLLLSLRSVRWYLRILIILSKTVVMRSSM